ncbi:pyrBI operon leader peptide domain-containing protein [Rhizoctonia solani AG-1 IA]|uniref:PyrBI operon leader peptide domain-containing protein n=1 Tax=Thanatephorus cucumeris (strain AG1-IA) TaxID=983506 RepID=L8WVG0_THACA|nr:pyrBI operon leader peptide domain-containing protein [Rhizoctonia solani AG-1 IA]
MPNTAIRRPSQGLGKGRPRRAKSALCLRRTKCVVSLCLSHFVLPRLVRALGLRPCAGTPEPAASRVCSIVLS